GSPSSPPSPPPTAVAPRSTPAPGRAPPSASICRARRSQQELRNRPSRSQTRGTKMSDMPSDPEFPSLAAARPPSDAALLERTLFEVKRVIVGQDRMVERMLVCLLARGHCLIEGVPGLAKTLAVE